MNKKLMIVGLITVLAVVFAACTPGPEGPAGPAGPQGDAGPQAELTCVACHNESALLLAKDAQFEESLHGTGDSWARGTSAGCAGCHGSDSAANRINAGLAPHDAAIEGSANVAPMNCRTCHNIHTTYTGEDFSLSGNEAAVTFEYSDGTFDGGAGNLCANCHQVRNAAPEVVDGNVSITSNRYGTHYGTEAPMMLGVGGLGITGAPSAHYQMVTDTCVACHMGEEYNHTYEPAVSRCTSCHTDTKNFDIDGAQTEVAGLLEEVHAILIEKGLLNPDTDLFNASSSAPLVVPEAVAQAMWNYKFVTYDGSNGVHNSAYAKALLEAALATLQAYNP